MYMHISYTIGRYTRVLCTLNGYIYRNMLYMNANGYIYIICEKIFSIMLIVSIYVATTRSKIMPFKLLILCLFLKILFDILIKNKILKKNKNLEDIYVTTMLVLSSLLLLYVIYINKNRFNIK